MISSATSLEGRFVIVNLREAGTGGHASLDVEIEESECVPGRGCVSEIELPLILRPSRIDDFEDDDELELELSLGLHTPNGPTFTPLIGLSELWFADMQPANTLDMRGVLTYERVRFTGEPQEWFTPPQFGSFEAIAEEQPLTRVTIEIEDNCHGMLRTVTREDGSWHIYVPDEDGCLIYGPHTMRAIASTSFGVYRIAAQRLADLATPPYDDNDFVTQKDFPTMHVDPWPYEDHNWGKRCFSRDDLFYPWFASMQIGIRAQEFAKPFLVGDANTGVFPWAYLRVTPGESCGTTSCYVHSSQAIYVSDIPNNIDAEDEQALSHEMFHWFANMFMASHHGNNNCNTVPWSGGFGEGFATMMATFITGQPWIFTGRDHSLQAENPDFQGVNNYMSGPGTIGSLPYDLYEETNDCASGGWSWRILWDFLDGSEAEPWGEFAHFIDGANNLGPNPTIIDHGTSFDTVGGPYKLQDVIVRYLGGNYMPENPSRPDLDDRGQDGIDMTEFLDGILCRGHEEWVDMEGLVLDMMRFTEYNPLLAPASCP